MGRDLILNQCNVCVCASREEDGEIHLKCWSCSKTKSCAEPSGTSPCTLQRLPARTSPGLPGTGSCSEPYLGTPKLTSGKNDTKPRFLGGVLCHHQTAMNLQGWKIIRVLGKSSSIIYKWSSFHSKLLNFPAGFLIASVLRSKHTYTIIHLHVSNLCIYNHIHAHLHSIYSIYITSVCVCFLCVCVSLHHRLLCALKRPSVLRKKTHRTAVRQQIWHGHHFQSLTNIVYIVYGEVGKWDSEVYDVSTKNRKGSSCTRSSCSETLTTKQQNISECDHDILSSGVCWK
jgi:hypothetical protein